MPQCISPSEFKNLFDSSWQFLEIVDLRAEGEFESIHVRNSRCIPMSEIMWSFDQIDFTKVVVFICRIGQESSRIAEYLRGLDKDALCIDGGLRGLWEEKSALIEIGPNFRPSYLE